METSIPCHQEKATITIRCSENQHRIAEGLRLGAGSWEGKAQVHTCSLLDKRDSGKCSSTKQDVGFLSPIIRNIKRE